MKDLHLLVWLTQLGLSVAVPLAGFILLAAWLRDSLGWGQWIMWVGIILALTGAGAGLRSSLKVLEQITRQKDDPQPPSVSFHDHD